MALKSGKSKTTSTRYARTKGGRTQKGRGNSGTTFSSLIAWLMTGVMAVGVIVMVLLAVLGQSRLPTAVAVSAPPGVLPSKTSDRVPPVTPGSTGQDKTRPESHPTSPPRDMPGRTGTLTPKTSPGAKKTSLPVSRPALPVQTPAPGTGYDLYLVLDDAGYNIDQSRRFINLPIPLTIAVLPDLPYSRQVADLAHESGCEVILHQPMEAEGQEMVEAGIIRVGYTREVNQLVLRSNLQGIPWVKGMNNHKGSLGTSDHNLMAGTMEVLADEGLYFLDSRTTTKTVAESEARSRGVAFVKRDVFLDDYPDRKEIRKYMELAKDKARAQGYAVMIGHVWSDELFDVLMQDYLGIQAEGFRFHLLSDFFIRGTIQVYRKTPKGGDR